MLFDHFPIIFVYLLDPLITSIELYDEFLSELELLEKFRITYSGIHPFAPVERDDQDVQRMVEALAVFSARSRLAGERSDA